MQKIVAGLMAITAMGASILADVDPITTVTRGAIAFVIGLFLTGIWTMVVLPESARKKAKKEDAAEPDEVESEESESSEEQEEAA